ncbi:hypothetical protein KA005_54145 [bacterium]|nr:hypothetical protein [bacterium]
MADESNKKHTVEEIARQFNIPLEEAEKGMENFMSGIPKTVLSEDVRRKKAEAISKLPPPKKGGASALKITLSLDSSEAEQFLKLKSSMKATKNTEVLRRLVIEATNIGMANTTDEVGLAAQSIIRLKAGTQIPHPTHFLEVSGVDDLRVAAAFLRVPIIELHSSSDSFVDLVAIDWYRDLGFFYRQGISKGNPIG